jgi:hypothetical protein
VHERSPSFDPHAASCEWRVAGVTIDVRGSSADVRAFADHTLGGPDELPAPRPLGLVERALWAFVVGRWLDELGLPGEVWPRIDGPSAPPVGGALAAELEVDGVQVLALAPRELVLRTPPPRALPGWTARTMLDVPIVIGRCELPAAAVDALAPNDLVTVERVCELEMFGGVVRLSATYGSVVGEVASGYVPRTMVADDANVELTVSLGTTRLTLRSICELAVGQIVQLGRPLAGPFEIHAVGRLLGHGELVDVDGELAVRIVSLEDRS